MKVEAKGMFVERRFVCSAVLVLALFIGGCAGRGSGTDLSEGMQQVSDEAIAAFYIRTDQFYSRLALRRFNSNSTYRDPELRGFFRDERSFSDYYADLAQDLENRHFERSYPLTSEIGEFLFDGPGKARVVFRVVGKNGLPLRWWKVALEREDHWERIGGHWWLVPGKL